MPLQIELLETFLDLIETRSFNRTAERLRVTQSTVSGRVQALESAVGRRLFNRSRAGTDLTTEGLKFEPHARALLLQWHQACRAVQAAGSAALHLRISLQSELAASDIGHWVSAFRKALPQTSFYIEPDYSNQMCQDVSSGAADFAVIFTPHPLPDLHFESVGAARYVMVSTEAGRLSELRAERYIWANYAPAFDASQRAVLPEMEDAPIACGQSNAVSELLTALGGSAYVPEDTAAALVAAGRCRPVVDAPPILQPIHTAQHLRHRHSAVQRRLLQIVRQHYQPGGFRGRMKAQP